jgi:hypothetical protein
MQLGQLGWQATPLLEHGDWLVDHQDIKRGDEPAQQGLALWLAKVERDRPLVSIGESPHEGLPASVCPNSADWVALRQLKFHHVSPEVSQQGGDLRGGEQGRDIEYPQPR